MKAYMVFDFGGTYIKYAVMDDKSKKLECGKIPTPKEGLDIFLDHITEIVTSNKEVGQQSVYVFNKDIVDKYNMDISSVNSLEDLKPLLQTVKENEPDFTPIATFKPYLPCDYVLNLSF